MDLEKALKRIDELDNELATVKKALSNQTKKVSDTNEKVNSFLDAIREQKKEFERMSSIVSRLGQFDSTITQLRVDFTRMVDDCEKRRQANEKTQEKLRLEEIKNLNQAIDKTKIDLSHEFDQKFKSHFGESSRVIQRFKEIESNYEQVVKGGEDFKANFNFIQQEFWQNKKRFESFTVDFESYKKKQDEMRAKMDVILNDMRTNDSRLNELVTTESERKQAYINFVDQLNLNQRERDRTWNEWQQQYEDFMKQIYRLLPELQNQQFELNKTKNTLDDVTQRFERRINELTEIYRLMDEKFRQEWATFKSDSDKKWSNISLVFDEKQGGFADQFNKVKERIVAVEDSTHEMQDVLLLMSKEIQKGMQSLMNMVNGWMDAFGEIKTPR